VAVSGERKGRGRLEAARWSAPRTRGKGKRRGEARGRRTVAVAGAAGRRAGAGRLKEALTGGPHLSVACVSERIWWAGGVSGPAGVWAARFKR
jgi:hypothetical protein